MELNDTLGALLTALGIGLMIGIVRERMHGSPQALVAGTRTHALICLLGCMGWMLGSAAFVVCLLLVGALTIAAYLHTARDDPGLTSEVALLLSAVLGGLSVEHASLAAALGVLVASLLLVKAPMQKLSRELISERELQDGLMLGAAALVVMPLLPTEPLDPWGAVSPTTVWRIVVLVMAVGMLGHFAQRMLGARWGLAIAGFFAGFASSTAAVTSFGQQAKDQTGLTVPGAAAALLANLASLLLFVAVVAAVSPHLLQATLWGFVAAVLGIVAVIAVLMLKTRMGTSGVHAPEKANAFQLTHALLIAGLIASVSLLAAWLEQVFGNTGALAAAVIVALAEVHAAAAGVAQLAANGSMAVDVARWGILAVLAASCVSKAAIAFACGGWRYGALVSLGLLLMLAGGALGLLVS